MPAFGNGNNSINVADLPSIVPKINGDTIIFDAGILSSPITILDAGTGLSLFNGSNGIAYSFNSLSAGSSILLNYDGSGNITISLNGAASVLLATNGGLQYTAGSLGILLPNHSGLQLTASGLSLNIANLSSAATISTSDIIAISQAGSTVITTVGSLFTSLSFVSSATQSTVTADSTHSSFNIGSILPNYATYATKVSRILFNLGTVFSGGSVALCQVTDGTNILMTSSENDITSVAIYESQLPLSVNSSGSQCILQFLASDGITSAVPTAGQCTISIEYDIVK